MKLLLKDHGLLPLGSTEDIEDPIYPVKFFHPRSNWTWYACEFDGADTFFGYVIGFEKEFGYFSLKELQENNVERDRYYKPKRISEIKKEYGDEL